MASIDEGIRLHLTISFEVGDGRGRRGTQRSCRRRWASCRLQAHEYICCRPRYPVVLSLLFAQCSLTRFELRIVAFPAKAVSSSTPRIKYKTPRINYKNECRRKKIWVGIQHEILPPLGVIFEVRLCAFIKCFLSLFRRCQGEGVHEFPCWREMISWKTVTFDAGYHQKILSIRPCPCGLAERRF